MSRLLDYDRLANTKQYYHYDEVTGDISLETVQDVTAIIENNKYLYNQVDERARWTDPRCPSVGQVQYASVPALVLRMLWKQTHGFKDQKALKKWMNDPDNKLFRTRPGRV